MIEQLEIDRSVRQWLNEAADLIQTELKMARYQVSQKTGPTDLVTTVDQQIEVFFADKLATFYPTHQLVAEEDPTHKHQTFSGVTWILDPIDGTLNFIQQQADYAISLAIFEDGVGQLAYIFDVERRTLYSCKVGEGVFVDGVQVERRRPNPSLAESTLIMNFGIIAANYLGLATAGAQARSVRLYGVASLEMAAVITGRADAYLSRHLMPWDIAAGFIMANELGLKISRIDGTEINVLKSGSLLIASEQVHETLLHDFIMKN
ncbi:inositol monophosphatase family protein [Brochothrix campestris]|uniref:Inositol-1-monophosphatase n=1 Tax=Brochothrix campestris FSL F6-1037 TaxID=1265861 RepID=W7CYC9_9LIST|nr:inositol monophosphatase family protein [Brochothrix campestris]EUJ41760.1 Inositol-1-monophosphatase [Brochothrix campestris FSL F6-1037]